jgi:hypothetical protein
MTSIHNTRYRYLSNKCGIETDTDTDYSVTVPNSILEDVPVPDTGTDIAGYTAGWFLAYVRKNI